MAQKRLLTNGNAFKKTDGRWCVVVWYIDERGDKKRKSFSGTTKQAVNKKITDYIADFNESIIEPQITEMYYVKKDTAILSGITDGFEM